MRTARKFRAVLIIYLLCENGGCCLCCLPGIIFRNGHELILFFRPMTIKKSCWFFSERDIEKMLKIFSGINNFFEIKFQKKNSSCFSCFFCEIILYSYNREFAKCWKWLLVSVSGIIWLLFYENAQLLSACIF